MMDSSFNRDIDRFSFGSRGESAFEQVHVASAVEHLAHFAVLAQEDATGGVTAGVAFVDADALELGHVEQEREPLLEFRRPRDDHGVSAFRDG